MDKTTGRTDSTKAVQAYLCASCQRRYIGLRLFVCSQCGRALQAVAINHLPAQRVATGPRRCCGH